MSGPEWQYLVLQCMALVAQRTYVLHNVLSHGFTNSDIQFSKAG